MGNQHNSHVLNKTDEMIKAVLTDNNGRNTTQLIPAGEYVCIPTPHGRVSVSVFRSKDGVNWGQFSEADYTDDSDYSFIVKKVGNQVNIVRSTYKHITQEATGLR